MSAAHVVVMEIDDISFVVGDDVDCLIASLLISKVESTESLVIISRHTKRHLLVGNLRNRYLHVATFGITRRAFFGEDEHRF